MIITCKSSDDDSATIKFFSNKWLVGGLCGGVALLTILLVVLSTLSGNMYIKAGKNFAEQFIKFDNTTHTGASRALYLELYEADTLLIISKSSNNDQNYIYLDKDCTSKIKEFMAKSNSELNIFWLKGNYDLLYSYECRGISSATQIEFSRRYFTGTSNVKIILKKYTKMVDRVKHEIVTIN